ncbi:retrovirus-related pol polyprotein from transposon TNT 1-94 [Tanacetum coccineum]
MNELVNDGIKLLKLKINTSFINGLPKKRPSFWQSLRNTNHVKESKLASLFGKLKYKENLIDSIYDNEHKKALTTVTPLSTAFISSSFVQDFQDSPDDEEDTRSSQEYLNDLEEEYKTRAFLAKSKRFFKKKSQRFSSAKATEDTQCHKCGRNGHFARDCFSKTSVPSFPSPNQNHTQPRLSSSSLYKTESKDFKAKYNKVKAKLTLLSLGASTSTSTLIKNKVLIAETCEWNKEDVSSDDNKVMEVKALMALTEEERVSVSKEYLAQTLNTCKEQLLVLKQAKLDCTTMQHASTEILKKNKNLRKELNELKSITKTWINSSKQVNKCISEQIPSQNKRILEVGQLTKDPSSSRHKDLVFIKSLNDNIKASIPGVERPWLSEAKGFILPNHDTGRILPSESQRNSTDPPVAIIDSSETEYDSSDESSVCSTFFPPLEKPGDAETVSKQKAIKTTLKSISTFKDEALKCIIPN